MNDDAARIWPEHPDEAYARVEVLTYLLLNVVCALIRGNDFDRKVRWRERNILDKRVWKDTFACDEGCVEPTNSGGLSRRA